MPKSFSCEKCHFECCKQSNYNSHLLTPKHEMMTNDDNNKNYTIKNTYTCICGKEYTHRQGLYVHKKKCEKQINSLDNDIVDKNMVLQLLEQNKTLQKQIIELAAKPSIINNNYNGNNNNNKQQFNLNFFLNETCKDAMNIDEFINTLVITDAELEDFGKLGYVQGISNILIRGLKELGEHHRPIHNTDRKRNVLYMKYKEGWEKEVDEPLVFKNYLPTEIPKMTVRRMIYRVSKKGFFGMNTWKQNNPTHSDITTKKHEEYMVLLHQLMCGHEPPDLDISKIVKIVSEKTLFITKR